MRSLLAAAAAIAIISASLRASDLPTVKVALPDISTKNPVIAPIDLRNFFEVADIHGQVVQFRTTSGVLNIEMLPGAAPLSVANFLTYVNGGRYVTSFVHRSDHGLGVIQGGGYTVTASNPLNIGQVTADPPIALEYNLPNVRGTIAMARTSALNSATSEWFINTADNTNTLGAANGGGYAVFGRVTGTGMTVVDAIFGLQVYSFASPFGQIPLVAYPGTGAVTGANLVVMNAAEAIPIFPATAGEHAVVSFSVANTNTALLTATVSGSTLNIVPNAGQTGFADITVTATDTNGNVVQEVFLFTVPAIPEIAIEQPAGSDIADGGSRAFPLVNVGASADLVFSIKNTGDGDLTLTGSPKVTVDNGADAAMFTVSSQPNSPVAPSGGSTTFTVHFAPTSGGAKVAGLHISNDDADEGAFAIHLTGTANAVPTLTLPSSPLWAEPTSQNGAVVSFTVSASDAEDANPPTPIVTPASGSLFPLGDTTVQVSATDSNGAQTTGSFIVRVNFFRPAAALMNIGAASGDPAPGAGTGRLPAGTVLGTFGAPAISDFRKMAARVAMTAGSTTLAGIYEENSTGTPSLMAYQGGPVPGISTAGVFFNQFADPVIAPGGAIAFIGTLRGTGIVAASDFGVWTNAFGASLAMVLREGTAVPGLPVGARLQSVAGLSLRDGELLAVLTLRPDVGGVTTANDMALLRMTAPGTATVLLREGRALPGLTGTVIQSFSVLRPALASEGQGRWHADGDVVVKVSLTDGRTMLVKVASGGTVTPILSTGTFATPIAASARWLSFGLPAMGSEGTNFVVAAALRPGFGGVLTANDTALLASSDGSVWNVFAREGDNAPVTPAGPRYATLLDPVANDIGQVAFIASLRGPGVTASNGAAVFAGLPGILQGPAQFGPPLQAVARLGDHPPDEDGIATTALWTRLTTCALPGGAGAGVVFLGETSGGDTTVTNKLALWAVDSHGTLRRLLRTGDQLTPGASPVTGITLLTALPGSYGATRSYNATGSLALLATFANHTQTLLRLDLP